MVSFECDYNNGACSQIPQRLLETNLEPQPGYGADQYTESAKNRIRAACGLPGADVELLAGGTQTNAAVISTLLREHEGVIAAATGHISTHEAGAIEYTGHKVIELPGTNGKLSLDALRRWVDGFYRDASREHMVWPGMVYVSYPTEYGTLYSKAELAAISALCRKSGILLFLDGARLGYGLMSPEADLSLEEIAQLCDVFYIGGTKVGALCGEAVVFARIPEPPHFLNAVKKRGALLAKGRLLGLQFDTLFTDDLYFRLGKHGIDAAGRLKQILREAGIPFYLETPTNQQFILLEDEKLEKLDREVSSSYWEKPDPEHTVVRLATSWSTTEEDLEALRAALQRTGG